MRGCHGGCRRAPTCRGVHPVVDRGNLRLPGHLKTGEERMSSGRSRGYAPAERLRIWLSRCSGRSQKSSTQESHPSQVVRRIGARCRRCRSCDSKIMTNGTGTAAVGERHDQVLGLACALVMLIEIFVSSPSALRVQIGVWIVGRPAASIAALEAAVPSRGVLNAPSKSRRSHREARARNCIRARRGSEGRPQPELSSAQSITKLVDYTLFARRLPRVCARLARSDAVDSSYEHVEAGGAIA